MLMLLMGLFIAGNLFPSSVAAFVGGGEPGQDHGFAFTVVQALA
ncbi:hypothetical protein ACWEKM_30610 [Streptomyces sp. NPDC004752]